MLFAHNLMLLRGHYGGYEAYLCLKQSYLKLPDVGKLMSQKLTIQYLRLDEVFC